MKIPTRVTTGNGGFLLKVNAIKMGSTRQKIREPFHIYGKSTISDHHFLTSIVRKLNENMGSP
jgi:hypothetical protein